MSLPAENDIVVIRIVMALSALTREFTGRHLIAHPAPYWARPDS
jgi:hypothetical protein